MGLKSSKIVISIDSWKLILRLIWTLHLQSLKFYIFYLQLCKSNFAWFSVSRFGDFFKFLATNSIEKVAICYLMLLQCLAKFGYFLFQHLITLVKLYGLGKFYWLPTDYFWRRRDGRWHWHWRPLTERLLTLFSPNKKCIFMIQVSNIFFFFSTYSSLVGVRRWPKLPASSPQALGRRRSEGPSYYVTSK